MIGVFKNLLAIAFAASLLPSVSEAAPFNSATIRRIVDGREVFIDQQEATVNDTADQGQELSTGNSRAEVLFDRRALGFLGNNSLIRLGEDCFRLDRGQVLVNGPQNSCLGTKVLGIRGTTYVLTVRDDGNYELAVLSGEASVSDGIEAADIEHPRHPHDVPHQSGDRSVHAWEATQQAKPLGGRRFCPRRYPAFSLSVRAFEATFFIATQPQAAILMALGCQHWATNG